MKKQSGWKTKGMNRDLSVSAFNPEFAFENMNLRLTTNDGNTLMSWVNEKGTKPLTMMYGKQGRGAALIPAKLEGTAIGTAVLNDYLVIFLTNRPGDNPDAIYRFHYSSGCNYLLAEPLYTGNLKFSVEHPIETLVSYEAEDIQKVYWVDGLNQPRIINIADGVDRRRYSDTYFDFIPTLTLREKVHVQKILGGGGVFAPGVIQYALTYYHKYGQESNIFYTTPLLYISHVDRGAAPDDKVDNLFKITIENPDTSFEFLRIYSIQRTSINATPFCKRVQDIDLRNVEEDFDRGKLVISYIDAGNSGESVDPYELLYKGGWSTAVTTMEQKDNTLFFGNFVVEKHNLQEIYDSYNGGEIELEPSTRIFYPTKVSSGDYPYANQLTSFDYEGYSVPCAGFKYGDKYRCGLQFQDKYGRWTDPIFLDDIDILNTEDEDIHPAVIDGSDVTPERPDLHPDDGQPLLINLEIENQSGQTMIIGNMIDIAIWDNNHNTAVVLDSYLPDNETATIEAGKTRLFTDVQVHRGKKFESKEFATKDQASAIGLIDCIVLHDALGRAVDEMGHAIFKLNTGHVSEAGTLLSNTKDSRPYHIICTEVNGIEEPEEPSENMVTFTLHNKCGKDLRLTGKAYINITSGSTRNWTASNVKQVAINLCKPNKANRWTVNQYSIPDEVEESWQVEIDEKYLNGDYRFMSINKDNNTPAIVLYTRVYWSDKQLYTDSVSMYKVPPLTNTTLQKNGVYDLYVYQMYDEATVTFAPDDTSGDYVILALGSETI